MSAIVMNNNNNKQKKHQQQQHDSVAPASNTTTTGPTLSVHDPDFRSLVTIPLSEVHHLPPAHLEISRLVLCRKYNAQDPAHSCPMGETCKFVHANLAHPAVTTQSIHVNYAWRSLEEVAEPRLPAGEMISVMAPNGRQPVQMIPSELLLATRGAITRMESETPLAHCAHYYFNRMCNRGDRCNFVHAVYVDPSAGEWQRAPPRAGAGYADGRPLVSTAVPTVVPQQQQQPQPQQQHREGLRFHTHANVRGSVAPVLSRDASHEEMMPLEQGRSSSGSLTPQAQHHHQHKQLHHSSQQHDAASSCDLSDEEECRSSMCSASCAALPSPAASSSSTSPREASSPYRQSRVVYVHNPYSLLTVTKSWIEA